MISRVHRKLGTAGFIISIVALVAALGGGAYAASGGLTSKQKNEVKKIAQTEAKKYAGKQGPAGTNGTNGAAGPEGKKGDTGANGAEGEPGAKGEKGEPGTNGAAGKSVEVFPITSGGAKCSGQAGAEYEVEGSGVATEICNGKPGSPWTAGGTLPAGATETGTWSASGLEGAEVYVPISFPIPVAQVMTEAKTHLVPAGGEGVCTGSNVAPTAPAGEMCIYKTEFSNVSSFEIWNTSVSGTGTGKTGAFLILFGLTSTSQAYGTWAVTG